MLQLLRTRFAFFYFEARCCPENIGRRLLKPPAEVLFRAPEAFSCENSRCTVRPAARPAERGTKFFRRPQGLFAPVYSWRASFRISCFLSPHIVDWRSPKSTVTAWRFSYAPDHTN